MNNIRCADFLMNNGKFIILCLNKIELNLSNPVVYSEIDLRPFIKNIFQSHVYLNRVYITQ